MRPDPNHRIARQAATGPKKCAKTCTCSSESPADRYNVRHCDACYNYSVRYAERLTRLRIDPRSCFPDLRYTSPRQRTAHFF